MHPFVGAVLLGTGGQDPLMLNAQPDRIVFSATRFVWPVRHAGGESIKADVASVRAAACLLFLLYGLRASRARRHNVKSRERGPTMMSPSYPRTGIRVSLATASATTTSVIPSWVPRKLPARTM